MTCLNFGNCGGCDLYDLDYTDQTKQKIDNSKLLFGKFFDGEFDFFSSSEDSYRCRAEFRAWKDDTSISLSKVSFDRRRFPISECKLPLRSIQEHIPHLISTLQRSDIFKSKLYAFEFLASRGGEIVTTLIYHKKIDEEFIKEAEKLGLNLILRSKNQKVVIGKDFVNEEFCGFRFRLHEGSFIQPNPEINEKMIEWSSTYAKNFGGDMLELYCGHGNFTIPLSRHFEKVLATEISTQSIVYAKENMGLNGVENIYFARLSGEESIEALNRERAFFRLRDLDLDSFNFSTVLVDPPRAGLNSAISEYIKGFENIIYISCNQESLARDLEILTQSHKIEHFALFDQFPYTKHIESGVILRNRQ